MPMKKGHPRTSGLTETGPPVTDGPAKSKMVTSLTDYLLYRVEVDAVLPRDLLWRLALVLAHEVGKPTVAQKRLPCRALRIAAQCLPYQLDPARRLLRLLWPWEQAH